MHIVNICEYIMPIYVYVYIRTIGLISDHCSTYIALRLLRGPQSVTLYWYIISFLKSNALSNRPELSSHNSVFGAVDTCVNMSQWIIKKNVWYKRWWQNCDNEPSHEIIGPIVCFKYVCVSKSFFQSSVVTLFNLYIYI